MLQVTLPDELEARVQAHAQETGHQIADWITSALEKQLRQEALEAKLLEALESGPPQRTDDKWWQDLEAEVMERLKAQDEL